MKSYMNHTNAQAHTQLDAHTEKVRKTELGCQKQGMEPGVSQGEGATMLPGSQSVRVKFGSDPKHQTSLWPQP